MASCSGSLVQSCCGEGGALQTDIAVCGAHSRVPATLGLPRTGVSVLSPSTLLRLPAALYGAGPALSAVPVFGSSTKARTRLGLRVVPSPAEQLRQPGACRAHSPRVVRLLPSAAPASVSACQAGACTLCLFSGAGLWPQPSRRMSTIQNLRKSLVRNWRPVCSLVGVPSLGPSLPLSPPPCLQRGWAGLPQASSSLGWLTSSFVLRVAGSVCGQVNFLNCYLLLAPSDCPQGIRPGPYPKQYRPLLSIPPPLAGGGCGRPGYFSAGSCF